jgi:ribonucleotide monophosphatase NagD (HAD superfamily)
VVSSRDALEAALPDVAAGRIVAALGPAARPLGVANELTLAGDADLFERAQSFAFLGSADWDDSLQSALEGALARGGRDLLVGNPDISAPLGGAFSAEPGYWAVRAMQATDIAPRWYGKPHRAAFDLAFAKLEQVYGRRFERSRVAMVGDSLHTDILGARAAGLQAVLLTGYGLFCDGGAHDMIAACGIAPDWIAATLQ